MNVNELLANYKHLIDFEDKMQKSNFKFVKSYISFQERKNKDWELDCVAFLIDAIDLQKKLLMNIRKYTIRGV